VSRHKAERLRKCGKVSVLTGGVVGFRITGSAPFAMTGSSGLATCGSVWRCACCAAKIAHGRAEELGRVLTWSTKNGHTVCMITLTMRHHLGHRLKDSWTAATKAWGNVSGGRRRGKLSEKLGVLGFVRALEVTYGEEFGFHPHIHGVLVLDGPVSPPMVRQLGEHMYAIWEKGLASKGYTALRDSGGLDIRVCTQATEERLAEYFVKQLAVEATHGHAKQGRRHGRTPFQVLADFGKTGTWRIWMSGRSTKRPPTAGSNSPGLKACGRWPA
jgi:hypothetical protein